jgi:hypothetical protein
LVASVAVIGDETVACDDIVGVGVGDGVAVGVGVGDGVAVGVGVGVEVGVGVGV